MHDFTRKNVDVFPIGRPGDAPKKPLAWGEKPVKDDFVPAAKPAPLVPKAGAEGEKKADGGEKTAEKSADAEKAGKAADATAKVVDAAAAAAPAAPAEPAAAAAPAL